MNGGIGLISSRLLAEGPIVKDKASFLVAGRGSYAHLFLKLTDNQNTAYFYDLNTKINYKLNENNSLFLSGYFGRDELGLGQDFGIDWGNKTGTIRWNKIISNKLFLNTSFIYSDYNYNVKLKNGETNFNITFPLTDKVDVKGDNAHEIYKWAKKNYGNSAVPKWNFHKILINKDGKIEDTFASFTGPMSKKIINKLDQIL